jgi:hypothetical protein
VNHVDNDEHAQFLLWHQMSPSGGITRVSGLEILAVALLLLPAVVLILALWWGDVLRERDRRRRDPER